MELDKSKFAQFVGFTAGILGLIWLILSIRDLITTLKDRLPDKNNSAPELRGTESIGAQTHIVQQQSPIGTDATLDYATLLQMMGAANRGLGNIESRDIYNATTSGVPTSIVPNQPGKTIYVLGVVLWNSLGGATYLYSGESQVLWSLDAMPAAFGCALPMVPDSNRSWWTKTNPGEDLSLLNDSGPISGFIIYRMGQ